MYLILVAGFLWAKMIFMEHLIVREILKRHATCTQQYTTHKRCKRIDFQFRNRMHSVIAVLIDFLKSQLMLESKLEYDPQAEARRASKNSYEY